jgi:hypothetical protein
MSPASWIAGLVALIALLGTGALLGVRALAAWRMFRSFSSTATAALDGVMRSADAAEAHAVAAAAGAERLAAGTMRLQESLARLGLLRSAAGEFSTTLARFRGVVPRK